MIVASCVNFIFNAVALKLPLTDGVAVRGGVSPERTQYVLKTKHRLLLAG